MTDVLLYNSELSSSTPIFYGLKLRLCKQEGTA